MVVQDHYIGFGQHYLMGRYVLAYNGAGTNPRIQAHFNSGVEAGVYTSFHSVCKYNTKFSSS